MSVCEVILVHSNALGPKLSAACPEGRLKVGLFMMTCAKIKPAMRVIIATFFAIALLGCRENPPPSARGDSPILAAKSMKDIERLLTPGMSTNEILARIGSPDWRESHADGDDWNYKVTPFAFDEKGDQQVIEVVLLITNGYLAYIGRLSAPTKITVPVVRSEETFSLGLRACLKTLRVWLSAPT